MTEVCYDCDVPLEMVKPSEEYPGRRFYCPECGDTIIDVEILSEYELGLN